MIKRVCSKAVWPTAPRDFIICTTWQEQADGTILLATMSVGDEVSPPAKGYVRGCIQISGYYIQPFTEGRQITLDNVSLDDACAKNTLLKSGEVVFLLDMLIISYLCMYVFLYT